MEELLALLAGAGAIALSPLLIPGVRPIAKSAVKGGMAVADAARGAAAATGEQLHQLTHAITRGGREQAPGEAATPAAATTQPALHAERPADAGPQPAAGRPAVDLRPLVQAAVMSGQSLAGAAAGAFAGVNKQWNDLVGDAKTELQAETQRRVEPSAAVTAEAPASAMPAVEQAAEPPSVPSPAEAQAAQTPAVAAPGADQTTAQEPAAETQAAAVPEVEQAAETAAIPPLGEAQAAEIPAAEPVAEHVADMPAREEATPAGADDLRKIRGIGPKAAELLQGAGITTFAQLAGMDPAQLRDIVAQAGPRYRMINPTAWPEEARQLLARQERG